eukprot:3087526-Prymnesium_polylepis.1
MCGHAVTLARAPTPLKARASSLKQAHGTCCATHPPPWPLTVTTVESAEGLHSTRSVPSAET